MDRTPDQRPLQSCADSITHAPGHRGFVDSIREHVVSCPHDARQSDLYCYGRNRDSERSFSGRTHAARTHAARIQLRRISERQDETKVQRVFGGRCVRRYRRRSQNKSRRSREEFSQRRRLDVTCLRLETSLTALLPPFVRTAIRGRMRELCILCRALPLVLTRRISVHPVLCTTGSRGTIGLRRNHARQQQRRK